MMFIGALIVLAFGALSLFVGVVTFSWTAKLVGGLLMVMSATALLIP